MGKKSYLEGEVLTSGAGGGGGEKRANGMMQISRKRDGEDSVLKAGGKTPQKERRCCEKKNEQKKRGPKGVGSGAVRVGGSFEKKTQKSFVKKAAPKRGTFGQGKQIRGTKKEMTKNISKVHL